MGQHVQFIMKQIKLYQKQKSNVYPQAGNNRRRKKSFIFEIAFLRFLTRSFYSTILGNNSLGNVDHSSMHNLYRAIETFTLKQFTQYALFVIHSFLRGMHFRQFVVKINVLPRFPHPPQQITPPSRSVACSLLQLIRCVFCSLEKCGQLHFL